MVLAVISDLLVSRRIYGHPNARLTPLGLAPLLRRHIDHGANFAFLAAQVGIAGRTAYRWLARNRSGCASALVDRGSVRRTQLLRLSKVLEAPISTVGRVLKTTGLGRLKNLQPAEPVRRY